MPSKYRKVRKPRAKPPRAQLCDGRVPDPSDRRGSGADALRVINVVTLTRIDATEVAALDGEPLMPAADIRRIAAARILGCEHFLGLLYEHVPEGAAFPMSEGPVLRQTLDSIRESDDPSWSGKPYEILRRQFARLVTQYESIRKTEQRAKRGEVAARFRVESDGAEGERLVDQMFPPPMLRRQP